MIKRLAEVKVAVNISMVFKRNIQTTKKIRNANLYHDATF